jgi:hypothetical protein
MSRALRILERARTDVDDIFNWLVRRSVRGAIAWDLAFGRAVEQIAASPESFAKAPSPLLWVAHCVNPCSRPGAGGAIASFLSLGRVDNNQASLALWVIAAAP